MARWILLCVPPWAHIEPIPSRHCNIAEVNSFDFSPLTCYVYGLSASCLVRTLCFWHQRMESALRPAYRVLVLFFTCLHITSNDTQCHVQNPSKKYNRFLQRIFCLSIFHWAFWHSLVSLDCHVGWLGWSSVFLHYSLWCAKSILSACRRDGNLCHGQMHEINFGYRVRQVKWWSSPFSSPFLYVQPVH